MKKESKVAVATSAVAAATDAMTNEIAGKKWYTSKTVWVNLLAIVAVVAQNELGYAVPVEYQAMALSGINLVLRKITSTEVIW